MKFPAALVASAFLLVAATAQPTGPFFDPALPIHATPVNAGEAGVVARGLLVRAGENQWVVFDQDLLRPALWFESVAGKEPVTLQMMAQKSWEEPTRKAGAALPEPVGKGATLVPPLPGVAADEAGLFTDPRPVFKGDPGRGGLEATGRKFLGYEVSAERPVLRYRQGDTEIREWYEAKDGRLLRHLSVAAGNELVFLAAGAAGDLLVASNDPRLTLGSGEGGQVARLAASSQERRATLSYSREAPEAAAATPGPPNEAVPPRWPEVFETTVEEGVKTGSGWILDRLPLPEENPWNRRIRPADIAFLGPERAAVLTFEGDVWDLAIEGNTVRWRRIAAGLSEPLSIAQVDGTVQVFTRNGLVRLHDRDGNGEADFYENHSSLISQTAGTRGYPLDMEVDAEGRTWCTIGGIDTSTGGMSNKPPSNPHAGGVFLISADGSEMEVVATRAREPFIARDPETGRIALSEQQGHYVPSSGIFAVVPGADFAYAAKVPAEKVPVPAVWIPHEQEPSSASPLWMRDSAFPAWEGGLLDVSYGTGRLFLVRTDGGWPGDRGSVIPLGIETELPILHARIHPDGSVWLAGMRIYDSRVDPLGGLGRLRPGPGTLAAPVDAKIFQEGVVLTFADAIDPASVDAAAVQAREWQYRRTPSYGSPRFRRDGTEGVDLLATGNVWLSRDGRSAFIHLPELQPTMQLEVAHPLRATGADAGVGLAYFSATELIPAPWEDLGFDPPQLEDSVVAVRENETEKGVPDAKLGQEVATRFGCVACHSIDNAKAGGSGPPWKGLFGSERRFHDGTSRVADAEYLRESILQPNKNVVVGYEAGMASYAGVLSDLEIDSVVLYIESLK